MVLIIEKGPKKKERKRRVNGETTEGEQLMETGGFPYAKSLAIES